MAAIEMSLLIDKPNARYFAVTILAVGLILRGLVQERRMKKAAKPLRNLPLQAAPRPLLRQRDRDGTAADRRRIDTLRDSRHRAHARLRFARSARDRPATLSALRPRAALHDRAGRETQMAG